MLAWAPPNESQLDESVWEKTNALNEILIAGEIETGVNLQTGDLLEDDMMEDEEEEEESDY